MPILALESQSFAVGVIGYRSDFAADVVVVAAGSKSDSKDDAAFVFVKKRLAAAVVAALDDRVPMASSSGAAF